MTKSKFFRITLSVICLLCIVVSGIIIIQWVSENNKQTQIQTDMQKYVETTVPNTESTENPSKPTEFQPAYNVNISDMKNVNDDIVGWLKIENTNIEYPVTQTDDNSYYLDHDLNKDYNSAGAIFMDKNSAPDELTENTVLFGHNRRDGSMFADLNTLLDKLSDDNYKKYKVTFITESHYYEGFIFAAYTKYVDTDYIRTEFDSEQDFKDFKDNIKNDASFYNEDTASNNILTLSTCSSQPNYRTAVHINLWKMK